MSIGIHEEQQTVYNFEVEGAHTYYVGLDFDTAVLVHNTCDVHDGIRLPDFIDRFLNADRNGINYRLFGKPIPTCTCGQAERPKPSGADQSSLGALAAHSPGGLSIQNKIRTTEQLADLTNAGADIMEGAAIELATLPLPFVFSVAKHGAPAFGATIKAARGAGLAIKPISTADDLIKAAGKGKSVWGKEQKFVKGNIDDILEAITKGGTTKPSGAIVMPDGTSIMKGTSRDTGLPTIYITKPDGEKIAVRFIP